MNIANILDNKRRIALISIAAAILILLAGAYYLWHMKSSPLQKIANVSTFPIYAPTELPGGYAIDESSISLTGQALLFTATSQDGSQTLIFTQTPVPAEYDFESFYKTSFVGAQDAPSLYGRGNIGILDGVMSGSLVTDSTWVIIKGPKDLPANAMTEIVQALKPV